MSDLVETTVETEASTMTVEQARDCVSQIQEDLESAAMSLGSAREQILALYEARGWIPLGYRSFEQCIKQEFPGGHSHVWRLLNAAKVARKLSPRGDNFIPEKHLRPLTLDSLLPEQIQEAWNAAEEVSGGKRTTAIVQQAVVSVQGNNQDGKTEQFKRGQITRVILDSNPHYGKDVEVLEVRGQSGAVVVCKVPGLDNPHPFLSVQLEGGPKSKRRKPKNPQNDNRYDNIEHLEAALKLEQQRNRELTKKIDRYRKILNCVVDAARLATLDDALLEKAEALLGKVEIESTVP